MDATALILLVQPACRAVLLGLLAGEVVGRTLEWLAAMFSEAALREPAGGPADRGPARAAEASPTPSPHRGGRPAGPRWA
ncbi:hypothetical protein TA3x_003573 [Tundrisphaera sp. TA3]|uniref:hypothetical protein n=1 Tax=Tundrisphaera sp. TA3 TaxID=3435775 RepID=UPI003EBC310D